MAKNLYKYNAETDTYELVHNKKRRLVAMIVGVLVLSFVIGACIHSLAYYFYDSTREAALRKQNEQLTAELKQLQTRTDEALIVMDAIADRDNNIYRVLLQSDPVTESQRFGGIDRDKLNITADTIPDGELLSVVNAKIRLLESMLYAQSISFDSIRVKAADAYSRLACIPAIQPISDDDLDHLSSGFGYRNDPVYDTTKKHEGIDFKAAEGVPVYATGKGKIEFAGWKNGYGNCIDINHGYNYTTRYGHLSEILVKEGQEVLRGQQIGKVGNTGKTTGSHLHYEVRYDDEAIDPANYFFYDLTPAQYNQIINTANNAGHAMD